MLEALSSNDLLNLLLYDTLCSSQFVSNLEFPENNVLLSHDNATSTILQETPPPDSAVEVSPAVVAEERRELVVATAAVAVTVAARRKRRRKRPMMKRKNKEEAETQRMTHIAVERNRRKQMNQHLAALRSLMPQSYVQKGDQASIVGGAIDFIKELEHHLQTLESQKLQQDDLPTQKLSCSTIQESDNSPAPSLCQFFLPSSDHPYNPNHVIPETKNTSRSSIRAAMEDVDVTLIETHANIRILSRRRSSLRPSKLVAALHSLFLSVLHLSVTTIGNCSVIYSISSKVEESCQLSSGEDVAEAVHHMLSLIEKESSFPELPFHIS